MTWVLVIAVVWVLLAVLVALAIGRAIRLADEHAAHTPAPDLDAPQPPDGTPLPVQRPVSGEEIRRTAGSAGG